LDETGNHQVLPLSKAKPILTSPNLEVLTGKKKNQFDQKMSIPGPKPMSLQVNFSYLIKCLSCVSQLSISTEIHQSLEKNINKVW
jgi:hypothetical protein